MKYLILTILFSNFSFAKQMSEPVKPARYLKKTYSANSSKKLTIQTRKCEKENFLKVDKYLSKLKKKNVFHLYAHSPECHPSSMSSVVTEDVEIPKNGNPTEVHITILSENIMIL